MLFEARLYLLFGEQRHCPAGDGGFAVRPTDSDREVKSLGSITLCVYVAVVEISWCSNQDCCTNYGLPGTPQHANSGGARESGGTGERSAQQVDSSALCKRLQNVVEDENIFLKICGLDR